MYDVCTRAHMSFMSRTLFGSIESQQLTSKVIKVLTVMCEKQDHDHNIQAHKILINRYTRVPNMCTFMHRM